MAARPNPIAHLVSTLQSEGDILVFLGAGSSTEGSQDDGPFPDFDTLVRRVLDDEGIPVTNNRMDDFLDVMKRWERESILSVRLASYLYGNPGISHFQLASVTMSLFPAINMAMYLTTNFDDLMFKALLAVAKNSPQRDPKAFSLRKSAVINEITQMFQAIPNHVRRGTPVIVKLFGDLTSNSPIFDSQEMPFDEFTEEKLVKLLEKTTLFIGYGLHDAPILRLLVRSGSPRPVFVVAPANPIDDGIAEISQRQFYWLPKTFSEFISDLIETFSARNPTFEETFASFLREADIDLMLNSRWALRECARTASTPARARYLNRARAGAINQDEAINLTVDRSNTGPDLDAFRQSDARILAIVGESGSGKSTLMFQIYEASNQADDDLYLYYDAQSIQSAGSLSAKLSFDFAVETTKINSILRKIASELDPKGGKLFVMIDALNESNSVDPLVIRYEIESLANDTPANVRFVFSCRRVFWDARMNPSNDLHIGVYSDRKIFILSKFSVDEAKAAYEVYCDTFQLKSKYESLSLSLREHIRDPLMLRFISEAYRNSVLPQFAPAVLVFREIMNALRRRYQQTPLADFLDCLIDHRLDELMNRGGGGDIFFYRIVRTDSNLALLAQQQMAGRFHSEHPLTILEDENIITPMESVATRFKFTYERFYEYLIGLRLHYKIFSVERVKFLDFIKGNLNRFRDAHYSFYQGLKSAFVIEYISTSDVSRRREIAGLVRNADRSIATFGKDIMREVIFESDLEPVNTLALMSDGEESTTALILDVGFESEGVLPFAISGLFSDEIGVRRRSVHCLMYQARNFDSLEKMKSLIVDASENDQIGKEAFSVGLVYFFAALVGTASNKSHAIHGMRLLLTKLMERTPNRVDLRTLADAFDDTIKREGPFFFGANYDSNGILYPWRDRIQEIDRYRPIVRALMLDSSPEALSRNLDTILFFSDLRVEADADNHTSLFAYQIEYRIVQWALIRAWLQDSGAVLSLLDRIVERGGPFNIDFALSVVEPALFRTSNADHEFLSKCRAKMIDWLERFVSSFPEFFLSLNEKDPFSFNLVPLAVLARVEAQYFTTESGVIPCISNWLANASLNHRKMALLAANWLSQEFPTKVLTTLEPTIHEPELEIWYDRVLAGYQRHSPRLLDEFFGKMHFSIRRRTNIRTLETGNDSENVQYQCESFFAWLFLGGRSRLHELALIYDMIYSTSSLNQFCLNLLRRWIEPTGVSVE
jgi:hypothetical protein